MRSKLLDDKVISGCAISGIFDKKGCRSSGDDIIKSIALMHERSNGLGGGFAAYGIYPEYSDHYAFHIFYDSPADKDETEGFILRHFMISVEEEIPTRNVKGISDPPLAWRYFVQPNPKKLEKSNLHIDDYVARCVFKINEHYQGAFVFSSGKNMGVFKGVGYPEDIGEYYKLDKYQAHLWTAHGRFPTNTPGWWGGAHPFALLDWSIVHNGEISSYGANKRYIEMYEYKCTMMTDTEVITYLFDLLVRKHNLPLKKAARILAPPLWSEIERMDSEEQKIAITMRAVYGSSLLNGPFSIILGHTSGFMALNDRIKLRPLVCAEDGDRMYVSSEESAIREICPSPERVWAPRGGEPVIGVLKGDDL